MKDRIYQALMSEIDKAPDNDLLKRQALLLPFARISTIDGFCNDIVRENFHDIEISPDYGILDNSQLALMCDDAVSQVMDELYRENSPEFVELVGIMANGTDDSALTDLICKLYNDSMAFARPEAFLDSLTSAYHTDAPLRDQVWGKIIINYTAKSVEYCRMLCGKMIESGKDDPVVGEKYGVGIANNAVMFDELSKVIENNRTRLMGRDTQCCHFSFCRQSRPLAKQVFLCSVRIGQGTEKCSYRSIEEACAAFLCV